MTTAIAEDLRAILKDMLEVHVPEQDAVFVVGCSTSEVQGKRIGKSGSPDLAAELFPVLEAFCAEHGLHLAVQCCEHLNRALVVERATAQQFGYKRVHAVPHPKAGGSLAGHAFRHMNDAQLVEEVQASYGIDIGETMIGMHMRPVVVPMRLPHKNVGMARTNAAFSRPPLIGGERALYRLEDTAL